LTDAFVVDLSFLLAMICNSTDVEFVFGTFPLQWGNLRARPHSLA
jgi:hypothetical protein